MPHPKREKRIMTYYIMINKVTMEYFVNKSTHPRTSVRHHFSRAKNPERADYNGPFYTAIREYGETAFDISYSLEAPEWMTRRAHYMPAVEGLTLEQMRGHYEPKMGVLDEYGNYAPGVVKNGHGPSVGKYKYQKYVESEEE